MRLRAGDVDLSELRGLLRRPGRKPVTLEAMEQAIAAGGGDRRGRERLFVGTVVLCEPVWVLRGPYAFGKAEVVASLERILATAQLEIDQKDLVREALEDYRKGGGDFADCLIGRRGREAGCEQTATLDRRLKTSPLFRVLPA